ncbi:MAG: PLP-dependent aminotransferase family protein [Acidobacteriota bacterium]|nr:PLP-dependent aminotransferase family protein [Acidobacteriota bacterium]
MTIEETPVGLAAEGGTGDGDDQPAREPGGGPGGAAVVRAPGRRTRHTAHELRRYEALFAARARSMRSSAMRDMFALTERPDVISLAGGLPDTSTFPPELYARLMAQIAAGDTARALQYGPTEGMRAVMDCVVQVMAAEGTAVDREDLIITTGGQQVLDLVCKTLIDPGDVIVAEAPTYPGAIPAFAAYEAEVIQVEMDDDGLPPDALEETLVELERAGKRPKLIYTIPNFQNPAGVTMSLERRRRLIEIARERELLVLEDNPYGLLRYEGDALPTLYSLDASNTGRGGASDFVIYLGTFSKILSPGVRLGWAVAPRPVLEKMNLGKQGADLCSSPMCQLFVSAYFAEQDGGRASWLDYVERLRGLYSTRRDAMVQALESELGGLATWTHPRGGLFVWATMEGAVDTTDLLARSEKVAFVPGRAAYMDGQRGARSMRLNFAGSPERDIREAVRRIGALIKRDAGLLGALTQRSQGADGARGGGSPGGGEGAEGDRERRPRDAAQAGAEGDGERALADVVELRRRKDGPRSQRRKP